MSQVRSGLHLATRRFTVAPMNKQASEARIAVRIPKESNLKERLVATSKGTGIPEPVLVIRAVEALVRYYEKSGHLQFPIEVRAEEQAAPKEPLSRQLGRATNVIAFIATLLSGFAFVVDLCLLDVDFMF